MYCVQCSDFLKDFLRNFLFPCVSYNFLGVLFHFTCPIIFVKMFILCSIMRELWKSDSTLGVFLGTLLLFQGLWLNRWDFLKSSNFSSLYSVCECVCVFMCLYMHESCGIFLCFSAHWNMSLHSIFAYIKAQSPLQVKIQGLLRSSLRWDCTYDPVHTHSLALECDLPNIQTMFELFKDTSSPVFLSHFWLVPCWSQLV